MSTGIRYAFLKMGPGYRSHAASYPLADKGDWVLDSKNRKVCWIPPDQRCHGDTKWDAHGSKIVWCSGRGLNFLDFSHISTGTDVDSND
jgi:hypothetical protein